MTSLPPLIFETAFGGRGYLIAVVEAVMTVSGESNDGLFFVIVVRRLSSALGSILNGA
jgi:hypothetical protein